MVKNVSWCDQCVICQELYPVFPLQAVSDITTVFAIMCSTKLINYKSANKLDYDTDTHIHNSFWNITEVAF